MKKIVEPRDGQAGCFEDRFEGFRLQYSLAMDGNGHAMSKAVIYSPMEIQMATFLIEYHETRSAKGLNGVLPGDPRETGHYTATSSASSPFDIFTFFSKIYSRVTARR